MQTSPSDTAPLIPSLWFSQEFPRVAERYGLAVQEEFKANVISVKALREDFFAALLGELGHPDAPTVFVRVENRFYTYKPEKGIFVIESEDAIIARLSELLSKCAKECKGPHCNTETLEFRFSQTGPLRGVIQRAKGVLEVADDYFEKDLGEIIACGNGMLQLADKKLLPFAPHYRRRNKLSINYEPQAQAPLFTDTLLKQAMSEEDARLLQQWCGLVLTGANLSQVIVLLVGTSGGGKGTFIRVLCGIIGQQNVVQLRTEHLGQRFETSACLGKILLYGADVKGTFLNNESASALKSLTGGDPLSVELKNGRERPGIYGRFNIIATSNVRLTVSLEGDKDAWARRLLIIQYNNPKPDKIIFNLSEQILAKEASGVLNWMLEGLETIKKKNYVIELSPEQRLAVDNLLLESESPKVFVAECLTADAEHELLACDCYSAYSTFCKSRGWAPLASRLAAPSITHAISSAFGLSQRNDIVDSNAKSNRGWKGIRLKGVNAKSMSELSGPDKTDGITAP